VVSGSRLIFALSRDGMGPRVLATLHRRRNVPHLAAAACVGAVALIQLVAWVVFRAAPFDVFLTAATAGTLILLVAYALATLGALRLVFFSGPTQVRNWEVTLPILGIALLAYTLYRNVIPWPTGSALWGPGLAIGVVGIVVTVALARPGAARRAGLKLAQAEGLSAAPPS
jgi:amino acid transporter